MKVLLQSLLLTTALLLSWPETGQAQTRLRHVEPAFWWTGMKNPKLQLLIHGDKVSELTPSVQAKGVSIESTVLVKNPNYLFLNLLISDQAATGTFDIVFSRQGKVQETYRYELRPRDENSANRQGFTNSDVIYLITPDRFVNGNPANDNAPGMLEKASRSNKGGRHGGDIQGMADRLGYIDSLGFTAIWVNPVLENNQPSYSYHGYSTTDYYQVDPRFGTNDEYRALAKQARQRGMKVIMDMIVNHCGSEHWWMKDLPIDDWLNFQTNYKITNHRRETVQDPYASAYDTKLHADAWFVPTMPDLNQRNSLLATYLIQNTIWWVEFADLSGIRMDTYPYPDKDFMAEWTRQVMAEYPSLNIVGEEWSLNPAIVAFWQRGKTNPNGYRSELPSLMDFPMQNSLVEALNGNEAKYNEGLVNLYSTIAADFLYADPSNLVIFPDNHDMSRIFTQLHEDQSLLRMALTYLMTTRGIPQLYYGTEVLMANPNSNDHGEIRSDMPGGWADDAVNAFSGKGLSADQRQMQQFVSSLLHWRKKATAIHQGKMMHFAPVDGVYVYFRYTDTQKIMVVMNKNKEKKELDMSRFEEMTKGYTKMNDALEGTSRPMASTLHLPGKAALILELQ